MIGGGVMDYNFSEMSQEQAENIALNWHYEGKYSFYDVDADEEDLVEFLDSKKRGDSHYIVKEGEEDNWVL